MRRREDHKLQKCTVNLYDGDYDKLMAWTSTRIGAAKIIRDIVHAYVRKIEEEAAQRIPLVRNLDLDLGEGLDE